MLLSHTSRFARHAQHVAFSSPMCAAISPLGKAGQLGQSPTSQSGDYVAREVSGQQIDFSVGQVGDFTPGSDMSGPGAAR